MPFNQSGQWVLPTTVNPVALHAPLPSGHPFDSLVPPYTNQTPGELLDRYYSGKRVIPSLTWPRGVLNRQLAEDNACGEGSNLNKPRVVIEFRDRNQEGPSTGVHVTHIVGKDRDRTKLEGAQDIVLEELKGSEIEFVIQWPRYEARWSKFPVASFNGGPFTRFDLAVRITMEFYAFFLEIDRQKKLPRAADIYRISPHFMQLRLVRFRNTIAGHWVADVEIVPV